MIAHGPLTSAISTTHVKCNLKNLWGDRIWVTLSTGSGKSGGCGLTDPSESQRDSAGGLLLPLAAIDWLFRQFSLGAEVLIGPNLGLRSHGGS